MNDLNQFIVSCTFCNSFNKDKKIYYYRTCINDFDPGDKAVVMSGPGLGLVEIEEYIDEEELYDEGLDIEKLNSVLCPIHVWDQSSKLIPNNIKRSQNEKESKMSKSERIKRTTSATLRNAKDVAIRDQKGLAVINVIRGAINKIDALPEGVKKVVNNKTYGDAIIGATFGIIAPVFSDSKIIDKAAVAAVDAGTVSLSRELTIFQDLIRSVFHSVEENLGEIVGKDSEKEE